MLASLPPALAIDSQSLVAFLDQLFARLDILPDDELKVAAFAIGGVNFKLRCSSESVLQRYLTRLAAGPATGPNDVRCDVVSAVDLGWQPGQWDEPGWQMHLFDAVAAAGGYEVDYPYFDRQWTVRQVSSGNWCYFLDRMEDLLPWDSGSPLRLILNASLSGRRRRMVHAGSLGWNGRGVLLTGAGGAGKSGTTLAGLAHELTSVGDDYVLLDQAEKPVARPLYRLLKQDAKGIARIPGLASKIGRIEPNWQEKFEFNPDAVFPGGFVDGLELKAVLLPVIARAERTSLERVPRSKAIRFLTTAMLDQLPVASTSTVLFLAGLTAQIPTYRMLLSEDPQEIAASVRHLIEADGHVD